MHGTENDFHGYENQKLRFEELSELHKFYSPFVKNTDSRLETKKTPKFRFAPDANDLAVCLYCHDTNS